MKGIIIKAYGGVDVLVSTSDLPTPEFGKNQLLIENYAAGLNPHDLYLRRGLLSSLLNEELPIVPGLDIAGKVVAVGSDVTTFKEGDRVYGMMDANEQFSPTGFAKTGAYAEFCVTREETLSPTPESISFTEAASIPLAALTAYQAIVKSADAVSGQKILINGASGGVGSMAIQIARQFGLDTVAVCSKESDSFVRSLNPGKIIHYDVTDFTSQRERYDIIFDVVGNKDFAACEAHLTPDGIYISNVPNENTFMAYQNPDLEETYGFHRRNRYNWVIPEGKDLKAITQLIDQGSLKPVVNRVFDLEHAAEAHHYVENNKARGKTVLNIK
ncbi:NADP-dependent oxidoreductase [Fulvivirgaceae bacterium BMA12]|uniref:NADP-dependent oxidoreductase n=1 Tax=Agaribacillus aureus TaxID=3051825 RepID=A0ABT8LAI4_9BACT|nr:NADP-dependent oxidoreductase [Fulvivirgaceae bacterium BMA12]